MEVQDMGEENKIRLLLKKREALKANDREACEWAREEGIVYAFDNEGNLLAAGREEFSLTIDGKMILDFLCAPYEREELEEKLSGEKREREVLYFVGEKISLEKYDKNPRSSAVLPLPADFGAKEIVCEENVFTVLSGAGRQPVTGSFEVMQGAMTMVRTYIYKGVTEDMIQRCCYQFLVEDHQNYMEEQEKARKKAQKMAQKKAQQKAQGKAIGQIVTRESFDQKEDSESYSCECTAEIWGQEVNLYATFDQKEPGEIDEDLTKYADWLNQSIKWIDENKEALQRAILDDDMVELACQWMEDAEVTGEDGKSYYELEDGELFPCPVTEQSFLDSLVLEGIDACADDSQEILFDMFYCTEPDFFACHSIEVFLTANADGTYEIRVNGLAG